MRLLWNVLVGLALVAVWAFNFVVNMAYYTGITLGMVFPVPEDDL